MSPILQGPAMPAKPSVSRYAGVKDRVFANLKTQELLDLPPDRRMKKILKMFPRPACSIAPIAGGRLSLERSRCECPAQGPRFPIPSSRTCVELQ